MNDTEARIANLAQKLFGRCRGHFHRPRWTR
jgi:hypothetical protein